MLHIKDHIIHFEIAKSSIASYYVYLVRSSVINNSIKNTSAQTWLSYIETHKPHTQKTIKYLYNDPSTIHVSFHLIFIRTSKGRYIIKPILKMGKLRFRDVKQFAGKLCSAQLLNQRARNGDFFFLPWTWEKGLEIVYCNSYDL